MINDRMRVAGPIRPTLSQDCVPENKELTNVHIYLSNIVQSEEDDVEYDEFYNYVKGI